MTGPVDVARKAAGKGGRLAATRLVGPVVARVGRWRARRRPVEAGAVTVVTVNYDSLPYLQTLVRAVRMHSPPGTRVLVVDNHSRDGSRAWLRGRPDVQSVLLPVNVGHGLGLDVGFARATTEFVVALDVDAFPITRAWLDEALAALRSGKTVVGAHWGRPYAHPCFLVMRRATFVERAHSFRPRGTFAHDRAQRRGWMDVGEAVSSLEGDGVHLVEPTSTRGPGPVGTVFGGVVYHNFFSTRFRATRRDVLDGGIRAADAEGAWAEAVGRYLGPAPTAS